MPSWRLKQASGVMSWSRGRSSCKGRPASCWMIRRCGLLTWARKRPPSLTRQLALSFLQEASAAPRTAESPRTTDAVVELVDDIEFDLLYRHHDQLRQPFHGLQYKGLLAAIPNRYH